jgi:hypothetical protein
MRKLITACVLAAFIATAFVGCTKSISHIKTRKPAAGEEPSITKVTDEMDKELENKLKAIDDMGKDVIDNIRTEASKAISEIKEAVATTTAPPPKEIALNLTNKSDGLKFALVKVNYEYGYVDFYYSIESEKRLLPGTATLEDNQGNKLTLSRFGATPYKIPKKEDEKYEFKDCVIGFQGLTTEHDLSTVTLTYAFEGFDPVTVTFDIPGI